MNQYFPQSWSHPGENLEEKLQEMNMGPKEFAVRTGKPEKTIIAVLKGESSITADMAVQFEKVTLIPAHFWLNHQKNYDEYIAREKRKTIITQAIPWAKKFPLKELAIFGYIRSDTTIMEQTSDLLSFFGFASHKAWENYYFNQQLKVAFRISLSKVKEPYAISSWLRMGEIQANEIQTYEYSAKKLNQTILAITNKKSKTFKELQHSCLQAGVKLIYTPKMDSSPISGAARWVANSPLIQLGIDYKDKDFWYTFFHEAGHILLHGKKDIFLENIKYADKDIQKEKEADEFAKKIITSLS